MNPMKRLGMAAVLVVSVTLLASKTAWAAQPTSYAIELTAVGDEPQASGVASFRVTSVTTDYVWPGTWVRLSSGKLTMTCANLTPGATYRTPAGTFTADATGAGSVTAKVTLGVSGYESYEWPCIVDVVRLNPDDSTTTVLTGEWW